MPLAIITPRRQLCIGPALLPALLRFVGASPWRLSASGMGVDAGPGKAGGFFARRPGARRLYRTNA